LRMEEKLAQLQSKIEADKGLAEELFSVETPEEVQSLLKEQGLEFTTEEIGLLREAMATIVGKDDVGELSDEDLEGVAGGISGEAVAGIIGAVSAFVQAIGGVVDNIIRSRW